MAAAPAEASSSSPPARPKLVVFDLDACIWSPEMYELWGGGAPFTYDAAANTCTDSNGVVVRLLGAIPEVFDEIRAWGGQIAIASRTDEPSWAREILNKFRTRSGETLMACVAPKLDELYKKNKTTHLGQIWAKSSIDYAAMIFFDDDPRNISDVSGLDVLSILTPQGVTREVFDQGLAAFAKRKAP